MEAKGGEEVIYIGIDPGKDGAVAVIGEGISGLVVDIYDAPTRAVRKNSSKRDYDESAMVAILSEYAHRHGVVAGLENVHAMKGQGVTSMFSMGEGLGLWRGILAMGRIPWQFVTPQSWKRALMDGQPKEKAASVIVASRLYPHYAHLLLGKLGGPKDGRADALLIAEYVKRTSQRSAA
jgi:hypothetical protein